MEEIKQELDDLKDDSDEEVYGGLNQNAKRPDDGENIEDDIDNI